MCSSVKCILVHQAASLSHQIYSLADYNFEMNKRQEFNFISFILKSRDKKHLRWFEMHFRPTVLNNSSFWAWNFLEFSFAKLEIISSFSRNFWWSFPSSLWLALIFHSIRSLERRNFRAKSFLRKVVLGLLNCVNFYDKSSKLLSRLTKFDLWWRSETCPICKLTFWCWSRVLLFRVCSGFGRRRQKFPEKRPAKKNILQENRRVHGVTYSVAKSITVQKFFEIMFWQLQGYPRS